MQMYLPAHNASALPHAATASLRILHVAPNYYPAVRYGGLIRSVQGLAEALAQRGHKVHVYTTSVDGDDDLDVPIGCPVEIGGVSVYYFRVPAMRRLHWSPEMGKRLEEAVREFDVVHLHSIYLWPTWAAARAARRNNVPYVVSPHGMLVSDLIRGKNRWIKTAWINLMERGSLKRASALHCSTDWETKQVNALGLPLPTISTIPQGVVWPDEYIPLSDGPFADISKPYALFLGRISREKGLDRLISAWKWVSNLDLVIAGSGDEHLQRKLQSELATAGMADRVRFVGHASDTHKWALLKNAEMLVLTSYSENFGYVVAEAMAMACPVVITPEVGLAALVRESDAGIVVDGEPQKFAKTVCALHADETRRHAMGLRGRAAVGDSLSWTAASTRMAALYKSISAGAEH